MATMCVIVKPWPTYQNKLLKCLLKSKTMLLKKSHADITNNRSNNTRKLQIFFINKINFPQTVLEI